MPGTRDLPASAADVTVADVTVVICAYTEARWQQTRVAIESALDQRPAPAGLLLVIDHNEGLAATARRELAGQARVRVVESDGEKGLSGARNHGLALAGTAITAFLDDDARARPGWLAALIAPYQAAGVVATGGAIHPIWPGRAPRWLSGTFYWVVGCTYTGLPERGGPVRNPIGASMSMLTRLALDAGGFDTGVGRVGARPRGGEETELAIRMTAGRPGAMVMYVPESAVDHHVSADRVRFGYFLSRCWHEGRSKADVVRLAGARAGLERERRQAAAVIPAALARDLRAGVSGDPAGLARFVSSVAGLTAAIGGYAAGSIGRRGPGRRVARVASAAAANPPAAR